MTECPVCRDQDCIDLACECDCHGVPSLCYGCGQDICQCEDEEADASPYDYDEDFRP